MIILGIRKPGGGTQPTAFPTTIEKKVTNFIGNFSINLDFNHLKYKSFYFNSILLKIIWSLISLSL